MSIWQFVSQEIENKYDCFFVEVSWNKQQQRFKGVEVKVVDNDGYEGRDGSVGQYREEGNREGELEFGVEKQFCYLRQFVVGVVDIRVVFLEVGNDDEFFLFSVVFGMDWVWGKNKLEQKVLDYGEIISEVVYVFLGGGVVVEKIKFVVDQG